MHESRLDSFDMTGELEAACGESTDSGITRSPPARYTTATRCGILSKTVSPWLAKDTKTEEAVRGRKPIGTCKRVFSVFLRQRRCLASFRRLIVDNYSVCKVFTECIFSVFSMHTIETRGLCLLTCDRLVMGLCHRPCYAKQARTVGQWDSRTVYPRFEWR